MSQSENHSEKRLIQRHLSENSRREFTRDWFVLMMLFVCLFAVGTTLSITPNRIKADHFVALAYYVLMVFFAIAFVALLIMHIIAMFKHFRQIQAVEDTWVQYQHLTTASTNTLQDQLIAAEETAGEHNRSILALRQEQNRLRSECDQKIAVLENQIAMERKLMSADGLDTEITLIKQILTLRQNLDA